MSERLENPKRFKGVRHMAFDLVRTQNLMTKLLVEADKHIDPQSLSGAERFFLRHSSNHARRARRKVAIAAHLFRKGVCFFERVSQVAKVQ